MRAYLRPFVAVLAVIVSMSPLAIRGQQRASTPPEPTPRLADGTPNLGRVPGEKGVWNVPYIQNMADYASGRDAGPAGRAGRGGNEGGRGGSRSEPHIPFQPWAAAIYDYNSANVSKYDPEGYCLPPGGPRMMATPYPMEIIQLPEQKRIFMVFEGATHIWREIYMDGRPHPQGDALNPTYLGHSVGRWEGDTLVIDSIGFTDRTWLDDHGNRHSEEMKLTERFQRVSADQIRYDFVIDDPKFYTKPWGNGWIMPLANPDWTLAEYACTDFNNVQDADLLQPGPLDGSLRDGTAMPPRDPNGSSSLIRSSCPRSRSPTSSTRVSPWRWCSAPGWASPAPPGPRWPPRSSRSCCSRDCWAAPGCRSAGTGGRTGTRCSRCSSSAGTCSCAPAG